ncbi:MAG: pseudouridine synthase [Akkermansia sp.]
MRLDALLSRYGFCSRKESAQWIKRGRVVIDGQPAGSPSQKATPEQVLVDGAPIPFPQGLYVAFYKPLNATCSHNTESGELIYDYLPDQWMQRNPVVTSVGRLDKNTEGLLLMTDDGQFVHRMTSPKHHVTKLYELTTEENIPPSSVELFASGTLMLEGERSPCHPAKLVIIEPRHATIELTEGRYHQIRRMLDYVGAPVATLKRIAIGEMTLESLQLKPGEWVEFAHDFFHS